MIDHAPTPKGEMKHYLLNDLALARRHCESIMMGEVLVNLQLVKEIQASIEDCVKRIERDIDEP